MKNLVYRRSRFPRLKLFWEEFIFYAWRSFWIGLAVFLFVAAILMAVDA